MLGDQVILFEPDASAQVVAVQAWFDRDHIPGL
jgi:hypothetical protein